MRNFYDKKGNQITLEEWGKLHGDPAYKIIKQEDVGKYWVSNDGVVSCMHCGLPLHPVSSEGCIQPAEGDAIALYSTSSPPQNVGEECVCGHWESRHRPFCDVGDNADKCAKFVSVEKEDEALLKIAEERGKDSPDTKE